MQFVAGLSHRQALHGASGTNNRAMIRCRLKERVSGEKTKVCMFSHSAVDC